MSDQALEKNENTSIVGNSGNSKVDINININTKAIAYSLLCSLYATDRLNETQFEKAIGKFESIMMREHSNRNHVHRIDNAVVPPKIYDLANLTSKQRKKI